MKAGLSRAILAISGASAILVASCSQTTPAVDDPIVISETDPFEAKARAAEEEAIRNLPVFWRVFEAKQFGVDGFAVKVAVPTDDARGIESLWLSVEERRTDGTVVGILQNSPLAVSRLHEGARVRAPETDIVDWSYRRGGLYYGEFVTRVMLERASSEQKAKLLPTLSPTPLESQ